MQSLERVRRGFLDRVSNADQTGQTAVHGNEHGSLAAIAPGVGCVRKRSDVDAESFHHGLVSERNPLAVHASLDAFTCDRLEVLGAPQLNLAGLCAVDDSFRERMFRTSFEAGGEPQDIVRLETLDGLHIGQFGPALCKRSGLVDNERIDPGKGLQRLRILDQDAGLGTASGGRHDGHRRREAEGARTGDNQHRDRRDKRVGEGRVGPEDGPDYEGDDGNTDHGRHETTGNHIGKFLDRRAAALGLCDHGDDPAQHRIGADALGADDQRARPIQCGACDAVAFGLFDRNGFAGNHRLVDRGMPFFDDTVDRDFLARANPQPVSGLDVLERNFLLIAVLPHDTGRLGGKIEQGADGRAGPFARAQLHELAEQNEDGDHRPSFEIHADMTVGIAEAFRKNTRDDHGDHTEQIGRAHADRDEGEHVQIAGPDRLCAPFQERPAGPEYDRRCQEELGPEGDTVA